MGIIVVLIVLIFAGFALIWLIGLLSDLYDKSRLLFSIVLLCIILIPYSLLKNNEENFYLNHIPQEMAVSKILYQKTKSWGFGPGGNESGVVVFELPDNSAKTILSAGKDFFDVISKDDIPRNEYIRECGEWQESPLGKDTNSTWFLSSFLFKYGFGVAVDKSIENEINLAASNKGSFATGCPGSEVLIVAPKIKKVFYIYAG